MRRKVELIILLLLFLLLGYCSITSDERSPFQFFYTCFLFLSGGAIFFGNLYYLIPALLKKQKGTFFIWNGVLLLLGYFVSAFFLASWMADVQNIEVETIHLIHPTIIKDALSFLLTFFLLGVTYAFIRHLFISGKLRLLKKITVYTAAGIAAAGLGFFINYQLDVNYEGDTAVHFIKEEYESFEEISLLPQFRNKVVYVDLWFSSCSPCLNEFTYLPTLKAQLKNQDIEYLYLAQETSHSNSRQRWKNTIKKFNLQGWHVYMNKQLEQQIWGMILAHDNTPAAPAIYPRYLLIDKNGKLVSYNAKRPSQKELLIQEIKDLLH